MVVILVMVVEGVGGVDLLKTMRTKAPASMMQVWTASV